MTNKHYKQVREFHEAFDYKQADEPTPIPTDVVIQRAKFIMEELIEFLHASSDGEEVLFDALVDNFINDVYKEKEAVIQKNPDVSDKLVAQMDALTDISYFNYGTFAIAGVEPEKLFDIVHESNMSKLNPETGKPIYREDGKILKGRNFVPPEAKLKQEILTQKVINAINKGRDYSIGNNIGNWSTSSVNVDPENETIDMNVSHLSLNSDGTKLHSSSVETKPEGIKLTVDPSK